MKKIAYAIFLFSIVVLNSCSKSGSISTYSVTGLPDSITFPQYTDTIITLPFSIAFGSGTVETVNLSTAIPPAGVTLTVTPTSSKPPFSSIVTLNAAITTAGTYSVTVNSSATGTVTQAHTINLIVTPNSDCSVEITKGSTSFTTNTNCPGIPDVTGTDTNIITSNGVSGEVLLHTSFGDIFRATLDCATGTLTAPDTTSTRYSASYIHGTFSPSIITVNYTLIVNYPYLGNLLTDCTTTYTR